MASAPPMDVTAYLAAKGAPPPMDPAKYLAEKAGQQPPEIAPNNPNTYSPGNLPDAGALALPFNIMGKIADKLSLTPLLKKFGVSDAPIPVGGYSEAAGATGKEPAGMGAGMASQLGAVADLGAQTMLPGALLKGAGKLAPEIIKAAKEMPAVSGLASGIEKAADRIQMNKIGPTGMNLESAQKLIQTAKDYKATGSADHVLAAAQPQIDAAASKLKSAIKAGNDEGATVNIHDAIDQVAEDLKNNPTQYQGLLPQAINALKKIRTDAAMTSKSGELDLLKAQEYKQKMGRMGAWADYAKSKGAIDEAGDATGQIASRVNLKLKDAIEQAAPEGEVGAANKVLSDLIPLRDAASHRKLIESRNNVIPLSDYLGALGTVSSGGLGLPVWMAHRAVKTGGAATFLYNIADKLKAAKTPGEVAFYAKKIKSFGYDPEDLAAIKNIPMSDVTPSDLPPRRPTVALGDNVRRPLNPPAPAAPISDGLPPRRPTVDVPSNFPQKLTETPAMQRVIDQIPGRGDVIPLDEQIAAKKDLVSSTKGKEKLSHMRDLSKLNWKKSRGFKG